MGESRGEIAVRVLSSARELGLDTLALSTPDDDAHTSYAHATIPLPSASSYTDVDLLVGLCQAHHVDLVHPGYGFLAESAAFCEKLAAVGITFVGPTPEVLRQTGDKLSARRLAQACGVPVLPALTEPVRTVDSLAHFAQTHGFPIMLKAVDGGGGRGIRLVRDAAALAPSLARALSESPSQHVFAEKAAVDGFRHIEVQIVGDGRGQVGHFWERECSLQRRFQKIVEMAPAAFATPSQRAHVIASALRMAQHIGYSSLGTWEFLVAPDGHDFYFMEINPRLQVEHTITEALCGVDLVQTQLRLALAARNPASIPSSPSSPEHAASLVGVSNAHTPPPPSRHAIQLRITAEDARQDFALTTGRIRRVVWPGGPGVRIDTHVRAGTLLTADFDSLLAKVVVVGADWPAAVRKAERALQDTVVEGVATNVTLLQRILCANDFLTRAVHTQWLATHLPAMLATMTTTTMSQETPPRHANAQSFPSAVDGGLAQPSGPQAPSANNLVRKGDTFDVHWEGGAVPAASADSGQLTVSVTSVLRNDFPHALALTLSSGGHTPETDRRDMVLRVSRQTSTGNVMPGETGGGSTKGGAAGGGSGSPVLTCPIAGQLVEVLVAEGDVVRAGDAVLVVRQMKMELEVRAHRSGTVRSLLTLDEGEQIAVGTAICSIISADGREKL